MTTPGALRIALALPTPQQRVKVLTTPLGWSYLWYCCCGQFGRPEHSQHDAYRDWEVHREHCPQRPAREAP